MGLRALLHIWFETAFLFCCCVLVLTPLLSPSFRLPPGRRLRLHSPRVSVSDSDAVQGADVAAVAADLHFRSVEDYELQHYVHVSYDADQQQVSKSNRLKPR